MVDEIKETAVPELKETVVAPKAPVKSAEKRLNPQEQIDIAKGNAQALISREVNLLVNEVLSILVREGVIKVNQPK